MNLTRLDFPRIIGIRQDVPVPQAPYAGPGNVVSGARSWWGLRAYTLALVGNTVIRLRRDSDNAEQDFVTIEGGGLDTASITTFKSSANLFVVTLYDQLIFGAGSDESNATSSTQPQFILGTPCLMRFTATLFLRASTEVVMTQAYTASVVAKRTGSTSAAQMVIGETNGTGVGFANSANNATMQVVGGDNTASATDSAFHAIQGVYNGASSNLDVDGTATSKSIAATGWGGGGSRTDFNSNRALVGDVFEAGLWDVGFTNAEASAMSANQKSFWGF
jgi:hypothetical protein